MPPSAWRACIADAFPELDAMLARIQNDLFDLGADLCVPDTGKDPGYAPLRVTRLRPSGSSARSTS